MRLLVETMRDVYPPTMSAAPTSGFRFPAGIAAIDLAATLAGRLKPCPTDLLADPRRLADWLVAAGLAEREPEASEDDLVAARTLREAVYDAAIALIAGRKVSADVRTVLNAAARQEAAAVELDSHGHAHLVGGVPALLGTLARQAVGLIGGAEADRLRQCEGETCALLFIDTSRAGDRRWCSMATCGNRAKLAEFRSRRRNRS